MITINSSTAITIDTRRTASTALQNSGRAAIALLQSRYRMDRTLADTYLSVAIDFNIAQVVDLLKGVHPGSG